MSQTQAEASVYRSFHWGFLPALQVVSKSSNSAHVRFFCSLVFSNVSRNRGLCSQFQSSITCADDDELIGTKQTM